MKEYTCNTCGIAIPWEGGSSRGSIWGCETCGGYYCSQCADEEGGIYSGDTDINVCPECYNKPFLFKCFAIHGEKSDLNGYVDGYIIFKSEDFKREYEFLYRIEDTANGDPWKLVSIDYSYEILDDAAALAGLGSSELWAQIESEIKKIVQRAVQ